MPTLKLRSVAIDTYRENVVYLHRGCTLYRSEGFQALNKIEIHKEENGQPVIAVLNIVEDANITAPGELGISEQVFEQLNLPPGTPVTVKHATPPASIEAVHDKINGEALSYEQYFRISQDIVENRYSKIEIAAFLVGCAETGFERDEVLYLTRSMVETGDRLEWGESLVVDKHCIGGIPGNRTTMLIVPIVAAHGMLMPKTSSRAITSPAGTADTMEVLANVDLQPEELRNIVQQQRGCLAWGGNARLAPVDDILISVERPLSMDSPGQMVASILSKKVAAGATRLLIDIPLGPTAKVRTHRDALRLRKLFEYVGDRMQLELEVVITGGSQPIGRGIGPMLETRDVMQVLECRPDAPMDLREKALQLAGRILEFDADVRGGEGYHIARDILDSGRALAKMEAIIEAQGKNTRPLQLGRLHHAITAPRSGKITMIDNLQMASIARLAGAPLDKGAGVDLHKKTGEHVEMGEPLYTIYAAFPANYEFALEAARQDIGYTVKETDSK
ncbi:MAG TPA: thymidine phosphorylase family protein [Thiolapillus brandeum]|uniref:Putative thymidine phosphorylase n=1 Tax=Thiolapillus brandeum TaxID=1076588 RepID=A0A831NTW2_9GAMM|nr:thymidine phosphorylase family protein [Thiolapillus brandeum]